MGVWQWLILLVGVVLVVGMVLYARRTDPPGPWGHGHEGPDMEDIPPAPQTDRNAGRSEPVIGADLADADIEAHGPQVQAAEPSTPVLLYLLSDQSMAGEQIHAALKSVRLHYGMQHLYHRTVEVDETPEPVFSVANMLKPGTLDPMSANELQTKGLVLFMSVPNPAGGLKAFRDMLETAHHLSETLGARLVDERRTPLTDARVQALLQDIARRDPPPRP